MKIFLLFVLISFVCSEEYTKEQSVVILSDKNFEKLVGYFDKLLVVFYSPKSEQCKKFFPEFINAAKELEFEGIALGKLDATLHKAVSSNFNIKEYPTLRLFVNGKDIAYDGEWTSKDIVDWTRKRTGPVSKQLNTEKEIEEFLNAEVAIILFSEKLKDRYILESVAKTMLELPFAYCSVAELFVKYNAKPSSVVLFKKFDEKRNDYTKKLTSKAIIKFVKRHSMPKVLSFDQKTADIIFGKSKPGIFLYRSKNSEKVEEYSTWMTRVANKVFGKILVVVTDITENLELQLRDYVGIKPEHMPCVRIHDPRSELKSYNMPGEINEENILSFIKEWETGELKPSLKSDEIPTEQKSAVMTIVGKSYTKEVLENDKDVLLKFYAPWCDHCQEFAPIYEALASKWSHNTNLIIAEIDAINNEIEGMNISGYPTLYFYRGNKKDEPPIEYEWERDLYSLEKFLLKNCATPIKLTKGEL